MGPRFWGFSLGGHKSFHLCGVTEATTGRAGQGRIKSFKWLLNHYLMERLQIRENTCCTAQTRELLNGITAGQEKFSSGGQKCLSWMVLWIHSSSLFIVWVTLSCLSCLWWEIQTPLPCTEHIKEMKKTKLPTADASPVLWICKKMLFWNGVKAFYLVIPS